MLKPLQEYTAGTGPCKQQQHTDTMHATSTGLVLSSGGLVRPRTSSSAARLVALLCTETHTTPVSTPRAKAKCKRTVCTLDYTGYFTRFSEKPGEPCFFF